MKKISIIFVTLLCLACCFSCQDSSGSMSVETADVSVNKFKILEDSIYTINSKLYTSNTRGFLGKLFKHGLKIFGADCIGAVRGLFKGENIWQSAKSSSLNSAKTELFKTVVEATNELIAEPASRAVTNSTIVPATNCLNSYDYAMSDLVLTDSNIDNDINDSIGFYHNKIIYDAVLEHNEAEYWATINSDSIVASINNEIEKVVPPYIYSDTILSQETVDFCDFIGSVSDSTATVYEMLTKTSNEFPEMKNYMDVLNLYFQGMDLVTTEEEWKNYCQELIRVINSSELTQKEKECLKAGINVGYASSKLWNYEGKESL